MAGSPVVLDGFVREYRTNVLVDDASHVTVLALVCLSLVLGSASTPGVESLATSDQKPNLVDR
jgi:hypothetical protein